MLSYEGTGKNIEKAIEDALFQLKAPREDVDIKILEEGGLFKKAKVLVTISDDCKAKYEKKSIKVAEKAEDQAEEIEDKIDIKEMFASVETFSKKEEITEFVQENKKEEKIEKAEKVKVEKRTDKMTAKDFIKGLLQELKIDGQVYVEETADITNIKVEGGNSGDLIGYRGECLNAIQYIASIIENDNTDKRKKVVLDIENYRARREETLKGLAHRMESKVAKSGKSIRLEPMSPNERRIIHTELQSSEIVTTTSKGVEPSRFVIILPKNATNSENNETENDADEE